MSLQQVMPRSTSAGPAMLRSRYDTPLRSPSSGRSPMAGRAYNDTDNLTIDMPRTTAVAVSSSPTTVRSPFSPTPSERSPTHESEAVVYERYTRWIEQSHRMLRIPGPVDHAHERRFFDASFGEPPLSAPPRQWVVYTEDLARVVEYRDDASEAMAITWHLPVLQPQEEEDEKVDSREYITSGGESVQIEEFNGREHWVDALGSNERWHAPFPGEILQWTTPHEAEFTFCLDTSAAVFMSSAKQCVDIVHPWESLKAFMQSNDALIRIVPLDMWVTAEQGQLPVDCDAQLFTKMHTGGPTMTLKPWFFSKGPNPSNKPAAGKTTCSHVVWGGREVNRTRPLTKFWCDPVVSTPEFVRWACTDFDVLDQVLDSAECVNTGKEKLRYIKGVPFQTPQLNNELQFLCVTEWHRIKAAEKARQENGNLADSSYDKMKSQPDCYQFKVSTVLMKELIQEKRETVNAFSNVMSLYAMGNNNTQTKSSADDSNLVLRLTSIHSNPQTKLKAEDPVNYRLTVHIRYCRV